MSIEFSATGAEDLRALVRDLREAGEADLRRELYRGLQRATKPLRAAAKANATTMLPQRGGLAVRVERAALSTRIRTGRDPGVRILARASKRGGSVDVAALDAGTVWHPTFGHRPFVEQAVAPGWFTNAMRGGEPTVKAELLTAIDDVIAKLRK